MMGRCRNKNSPAYPYYGARGVTVCKRWHKFENFLADMGLKPAGLSLERRDNSKGYTPGNVFWADQKTQMRNTRYNQFVVIDGEKMCVADAAAKLGVGRAKIYWPAHKYGLSHQSVVDRLIAARGSTQRMRHKAP